MLMIVAATNWPEPRPTNSGYLLGDLIPHSEQLSALIGDHEKTLLAVTKTTIKPKGFIYIYVLLCLYTRVK